MALITKDEAFTRFSTSGQNSSHFVWFLADLTFFETSGGWVFGFLRSGKVFLFAFEPILPAGLKLEDLPAEVFRTEWAELDRELRPSISLFISVYQPFMEILRKEQFQVLQVGKEPYVALEECIPTGKSGKGVRAARNQAVRSGVTIKEWTRDQIQGHPTMERDMKGIMRRWKSRNTVDLGGFVNTVDPFTRMECRRYFLAFTPLKGLEAFLVATPIPGKQSYFLEDMIISPGATRGTGELLTLEAMIALAESGAKMASLGVVSLTSINEDSAYNLSGLVKWTLVTLPKQLTKFYNVGGLEMFRKRFKPQVWENIYLALRNEPDSGHSDIRAWLAALGALIMSFRPRLNFSFEWLRQTLAHPLKKHPASYGALAVTSLSYWAINNGGSIPQWALLKFGFYGGAPFWQWPMRSVTSDLLFFDVFHYTASTVLLFGLLRWMERTHKIKFVLLFLFCTSLLDDFINQLLLVFPYHFFQPKLFDHLIAVKDVGPSLWIATFLGLQICSLRKNREILFATTSVGMVLCFAFESAKISNLILNLNHFLFLSLGFIAGKLKFEHERKISRKVSRFKTPQAMRTSTERQISAKSDRNVA